MPTSRNDLDLYERHADQWWDEHSDAFRSLHGVNRFRTRLTDEWFGHRMQGATVVDMGCGGGLLTAPMVARGARAVGLDVSSASLRAARRRGIEALFVHADASCAPIRAGCADIVLLADVLEHLHDPQQPLLEAGRLLRQGGLLYVNTINRGLRARWLAVTVAEGLGLVPRGTHDPRLFIAPADLVRMARAAQFRLVHLQGEAPALLKTVRHWTIELKKSSNSSVTYSALFEKVRSPA